MSAKIIPFTRVEGPITAIDHMADQLQKRIFELTGNRVPRQRALETAALIVDALRSATPISASK